MSSRGIWCTMGDPLVAAAMARAGADWLCLDAQHGLFDRAQLAATLRVLGDERPPVSVRVSKLDAAEIGLALDLGADWVIVPMVDDVDQARAAVHAASYAPDGGRSWGPMTGLWGKAAPTAAEAGLQPRAWVMIETAAGLANVDEIAAVPGLGGILIGPNDLSLSLGITLDELLADASDLLRIQSACRAAGITAAAFGGEPVKGARMIELGFDMVVVSTDAGAVDAGAATVLS